MGFTEFNKENEKVTLKSQAEKIEKIAKKVNKISNEETGIVSMMVMADDEGVFCNTQGKSRMLKKALIGIAEQDEDFKRLIMQVASTFAAEGLTEDDIAKLTKLAESKVNQPKPTRKRSADLSDIDAKIKEELSKKPMTPFDTEDGIGFAINPDKIDEITEDEVDDIVSSMLKGKGISFGKKDNDESE
tara:strand:- start:119 stop:682 length:564 start_codon:yes stop_codon:yes gene_type:complete